MIYFIKFIVNGKRSDKADNLLYQALYYIHLSAPTERQANLDLSNII